MPAAAGRRTLSEICQRIHEISTLPHVALQVMEVASDPDSGAADMKVVMEQDAALSARVLRSVNSSAYALRTRIANLQHAIAYLGVKQIRNLAMTAAVSDLFRSNESIESYRRSELWRHLVSVGICARMIALRLNHMGFEDVFLAGLLHDVGIILADQHVHAEFEAAIRHLQDDRSLGEVEREHLGFDHTALGEAVAAKWAFPESVRAAIRYHHNSAAFRGTCIDVVRCVEVANVICTAKGISSVGRRLVSFPRAAFEGLALDRDDVAVLAESLERELVANDSLFRI